MIDIHKLEKEMGNLNFEVNPKKLYDNIFSFNRFLERVPDEIEIHCPTSLQPQYYAPRGKPITLYISILKEIRKWCDVIKNLAPIKCSQLLDSYTSSLEINHFLIVFQSARAFIETTALYKNEWIESKGKIDFITKLKPSSFNQTTKSEKDFSKLLTKLFDLLSILRSVTQRSRYDWLSVMHETKPTIDEKTEDLLRQRNVLTAISKIKTPETKLCKNTREHYEIICDFVHPNRGANMLFVERATVNNEYAHHVYSKRPKSVELLGIAIEFTTVPLVSCFEEILSIYENWSAFELSLDALINKVKFYEK
ncbi:MAG: hypothetical protein MUO63_20015 [Desulfobulbaceae bacterium]|nr:hypothetical protein [Desulfobulbaceae bacterium]